MAADMSDNTPLTDDGSDQRDDELDARIHRADVDDLIRLIDARTAQRDWPGILRTRNRARAAVDSGRQLWPVATLAEYRLALWASDEWCATVLDEESGRLTIGPLSEVAAVHHTWAGLGQLLSPGPTATYFAHERSLRGEQIPREDAHQLVKVIDVPVDLQAWEPHYEVATYDDDGVHVDRPTMGVDMAAIALPSHFEVIEDDESEAAFRQLVDVWIERSNGRAELVCVEGDIEHAIAATGARKARASRITAAEGLSVLAWAGSSGGAHGRRRGSAVGRFGAWWFAAALVDDNRWPPKADAFGDAVNALEWWMWDAFEPDTGWSLRLAIASPDDGLAWACAATDVA